MKYESDLKFGQVMFLEHDAEQIEYKLNRVILEKGRVMYELLTQEGDYFEVLRDFVLTKKDILKATGAEKKSEDNEDNKTAL